MSCERRLESLTDFRGNFKVATWLGQLLCVRVEHRNHESAQLLNPLCGILMLLLVHIAELSLNVARNLNEYMQVYEERQP